MVAAHFENGHFSGPGGDYFLCASYDPTSPSFDSKRYWRGPVWINLNWLIYHGFRRYGFVDLAEQIRTDTLELIRQCGFYEYFDPRRDLDASVFRGYGGNNFSWSAALYLDLTKRQTT